MIRVCPERDARCPHGMTCPHWIDRYRCRPEGLAAPGPEKAAPIPAESFTYRAYRIICEATGPRQDEWSVFEHAVMDLARDADEVMAKALADREAHPSLPDSREERISEDVLDRLYAKAREDRDRAWPDPRAWDACEWLSEEGAMLPAARARARQGGNNG